MKKILIKCTLFCTAFFLSSQLKSQVTIGLNEAPISGALLQLKDNSNTTGTDYNANKGMLMPRLSINVLQLPIGSLDIKNTLTSGTNSSPGIWSPNDHIGLVVYNTNTNITAGICPGLYVWKGNEWENLGKPCRNTVASLIVNPTTFTFASGINTNINPQLANVIWTPPHASVSITPRNTPDEIKYNALPSSLSNSNGNTTLTIAPLAMTENDLTETCPSGIKNYFKVKKATIEVKLNYGTPPQLTQNLDITQINKELLVKDKNNADWTKYPSTLGYYTARDLLTPNHTINILTNAEYKVVQIGTGIQNLTPIEGGKEVDENCGFAPGNPSVSFTVKNTSTPFTRYTILRFIDKTTPKRFKDVIFTIANCASTTAGTDLTLEEYKDIWEQMYGVNEYRDEPDSNGDEMINTNKVQWHRDQNNNIFFSGMFGNARWMTTNLAATTYSINLTPTPTPMTNSYKATNTPNWGYPHTRGTPAVGSAGNDDPTISTFYDQRPRVGLLYNFQAALGGTTPSSSGHTQGICPDGWHIPTQAESNYLRNILETEPLKYSNNTGDPILNAGSTVKDACEAVPSNITGRGASKTILEGGFSIMVGGSFYNGHVHNMGRLGGFWTTTTDPGSSSGNTAYCFFVDANFNTIQNTITYIKTTGLSVRCVKDTP